MASASARASGPTRFQRTYSTLPPLRWVAEEDLIYDATSRTLHRPACPRLRARRSWRACRHVRLSSASEGQAEQCREGPATVTSLRRGLNLLTSNLIGCGKR
jgi:hypothetical protein